MKNASREIKQIQLKGHLRDVDTKKFSCRLKIKVAGESSYLLIDRGKIQSPKLLEHLQALGVHQADHHLKATLKSIVETPIETYQNGRIRCGAHGNNLITRAASRSLQIICDKNPVLPINQNDGLCVLHPRRRGCANDFIEGISRFAALSDEILLAYLAGLAAPAGQLTGSRPGCVLNFVGKSSSGKSSALHVANSLMTASKGDGDLESSADTLGRLLDKIPRMPGLPFVMSDIKGNRSSSIQDELLTFAMCVGEGRKRLAKGEDGSSEKAAGYICVIVSSEKPILGKNNCPSEGAGEFARLIHLQVAEPEDGGIFERDRGNKDTLINELEALRKRHYGKVMPDWFEQISDDIDYFKAHIKRTEKKRPAFFDIGAPRERRVLSHLWFFYTVGLYAIETNFLHMTEEQLEDAFKRIAAKAIGFLRGEYSADKRNKMILAKLLVDDNLVPNATTGSKLALKPQQIGFKRKEQAGEYCYILNWHVNEPSSTAEVRRFKSELQILCEKSGDPKNPYRTRINQSGVGKGIPTYKICMQTVRSILDEGDQSY